VAGSLQKRGKKSWRLVVSAGFDPVTGRRRQVRRTVRGSKREAELALARLVVEVQGGSHLEQSRMTLAAYLRDRYLERARTRLRPETWERYESLLRVHVIPSIGSIPLDKLRASHVDLVMAEMAKRGAAPASVRQAYRVLSRALKEAVRLQLMPTNPAERVDPPRVPRADLEIPTQEGLSRLLDRMRGTRWAFPIAFAIGTGLRRGELLGLRWSDVDFARRSVHVNWELQRHRGRGLVFVEPKTHRARRQVRLSESLVAVLEEVRREQNERRRILGGAWQQHEIVFDAGDGRPIDPDYFTEACKRTFKAAGMPGAMRLHDLRHAFGSLLFAAGVHPKIASAALGHASEAFTMSVYQHMLDGMGERVAEVISVALPGLGTKWAHSERDAAIPNGPQSDETLAT
jgi:integrase